MTAISATLTKPTPQPDRDVAPQSEAEGSNQSGTGARGGFADALRAASGRPTKSGGAADERPKAGSDDAAAGTSDAAQAAPAIPVDAPVAADPTNAAAAILASILNAASPSILTAANLPAATVTVASDVVAEDGASAPRSDASAPASTGGSGSLVQGGTELAMTNAARQAASRADGTDPAGTSAGNLPKVAVLGSAVHFKPVLPQAPREPTLAAAAASTPVPVPPAAAESPSVQAGLPNPSGAALRPDRTGLPKPAAATLSAPAAGQPQPSPDPAGAAARAAGAGLEKADVTALADTRAVTGIARAVLASAGTPEAAQSSGSEEPAGAVPGLPAGTLPTIAASIRDELDRAAGTEAAARTSQADQAAQTAPDGPLRVLRIQLKPEDLGTVTVELRLVNGQLETHLRASQPETAALLHRDAAILGDLLKQANYQAQVTVSEARPSDSGGFSGNAPSQQGQSGFSEGGARPGQGGDRQRQAEQGPAAGRREGERGDETTRPRDGGVYL